MKSSKKHPIRAPLILLLSIAIVFFAVRFMNFSFRGEKPLFSAGGRFVVWNWQWIPALAEVDRLGNTYWVDVDRHIVLIVPADHSFAQEPTWLHSTATTATLEANGVLLLTLEPDDYLCYIVRDRSQKQVVSITNEVIAELKSQSKRFMGNIPDVLSLVMPLN